jgi:putative flippase GtrA
LVWSGSLGLNCALVYLLTEHVGLTYTWSKAATALIVGACFNFPLHRHYVFR